MKNILFEQFIKLHKYMGDMNDIIPFSSTCYIDLETKHKYYGIYSFDNLLCEQFVSLKLFEPLETIYLYFIGEYKYIKYDSKNSVLAIVSFTQDGQYEHYYKWDADLDLIMSEINISESVFNNFLSSYKAIYTLESLA